MKEFLFTIAATALAGAGGMLIAMPLARLRQTIANVAVLLSQRGDVICSSAYSTHTKVEHDQVREQLRLLQAQLRAHADGLLFYHVFWAIRLVPQKRNVFEAAGLLTRLSNTIVESSVRIERSQDRAAAARLLRIRLV